MKCIICGSDEELTFEHIIPESLGNKKFGENLLCRKCNSAIGRIIDSRLCNDDIIATMRLFFGIDGKTGKFPKLVGELLENEMPASIVNGKLRQSSLVDEIEEGRFRVHANSYEEAINIISKKLKRQGYSDDVILRAMDSAKQVEAKTIENPTFVKKIEHDFGNHELTLAFIKIAYEYAVISLGGTYLGDYLGNIWKTLLFSFVTGDGDKHLLNSVPIINAHQYANNTVSMEAKKAYPHTGSDWRDEEMILSKKYIPNFYKRCSEAKGVPAHAIRMKCIREMLFVQITLFCHPVFNYSIPVSADASKYHVNAEPKIIVCDGNFMDSNQKEILALQIQNNIDAVFSYPPLLGSESV